MKNKALIPLAIFFLLAGLFYFTLGKINRGEYNPRDIPTEFIGRAAPDFDLPDLHDPAQRVKASDMRGKVWLFNVWGTWCPECWREHAYLLELSRQGIPIVGLNWRDDNTEAQAMLKRMGDPFIKIGVDPKSNTAMDWGVYGAPETFLIDAEGIVRVKHAGAMKPDVWKEKFSAYFDKAKP